MKKALVILGLVLLTLFSFIPVHGFSNTPGSVTLVNYSTTQSTIGMDGSVGTTHCIACSISVTFPMNIAILLNEPYLPNTATFVMRKVGAPNCNLRADLYALDNQALTGKPSSIVPTALGSSGLVACSTLTAGLGSVAFTFTNPRPALAPSNFFGIAVTIANNASSLESNFPIVAVNGAADSTRGSLNTYSNTGVGVWTTQNSDNPADVILTADPVSATQTNIGNGIVVGSSFFTLMYLGLGGAFAVSTIGLAFAIIGGRAKQDVRLPLTIMLVGIVSFVGLGIILLIAAQFSGIFKGQGL